MHQPIQGIRFIHIAIKRAVADIEASTARLATADEAAGLARRVQHLADEVHMHTSGEEVAIYPPLDTRAPNVGMHYLFDHDEEEALFARLVDLLSSWKPTQDRSELLRTAASLRYHATLHIKKEDEVVVPLVAKHFTPAEQATMIQQAVSRYTPEQLAQTFPWIVRAQTPEDRIAFVVDDLMSLMPPEVFGAVKQWIAAGIPDEDWKDMVRRAPQLA